MRWIRGSQVAPILFAAYLSGVFDHVEEACLGIQGLSFVDDVAWWAEGKSGKEVAEALGRAAEAALGWTADNGVAFDHAKMEAVSVQATKEAYGIGTGRGARSPFNQRASRWLGGWIDSNMTLKEHHSARMKKARTAAQRIRRLTGQMELCPDACRRSLVAYVQASALYGAEL